MTQDNGTDKTFSAYDPNHSAEREITEEDRKEATKTLLSAASTANVKEVTRLIQEGADVNAVDDSGYSPLLIAAQYNSNPEIIRTLIDSGANFDTNDEFEMNPLLHAAAVNSNPEIMRTLISLGAGDLIGFHVFPKGYGDFGVTATNPIPTLGIAGSREYIAYLETEDGEEIVAERVGSTRAENIADMIDRYRIFDKHTKNKLCELYLCPYGKNTSFLPPKGFVIAYDRPGNVEAVTRRRLREKMISTHGKSFYF